MLRGWNVNLNEEYCQSDMNVNALVVFYGTVTGNVNWYVDLQGSYLKIFIARQNDQLKSDDFTAPTYGEYILALLNDSRMNIITIFASLSCSAITSLSSNQGYPQNRQDDGRMGTWTKAEPILGVTALINITIHPHSMPLAWIRVLVWPDVFIFTFVIWWIVNSALQFKGCSQDSFFTISSKHSWNSFYIGRVKKVEYAVCLLRCHFFTLLKQYQNMDEQPRSYLEENCKHFDCVFCFSDNHCNISATAAA